MYLITVGTKAQLVKMAPVILAMKSLDIPFCFILTGQHKETMQDLIQGFGLPAPDTVLIDAGESDTPVGLLSWFFKSFRRMLRWYHDHHEAHGGHAASGILVHGDTFSTLWGALFGKLKRIPVHHVEAGLRSFNLLRPFPEELVRLVVTRLSDVLYAPGAFAVQNLARVRHGKVVDTTHNTLLDSLRFALESTPPSAATARPYLVVSIHRAENVLNASVFQSIMAMVTDMTAQGHIKFVLHPVTRTYLDRQGLTSQLRERGVELLDRMDYVSFIRLLVSSRGLVTDGGSNQEESFYMGLPCLLMRKETERTEGLDSNVVMSGLDPVTVQTFVRTCFDRAWSLKSLPMERPSLTIAQSLADAHDR
jgi:UDP-N-acetylglucosamine 2-epimerase (non-hydrolysing)